MLRTFQMTLLCIISASDGFDIRAKTVTVASGSTTVTLTGDAADGDGYGLFSFIML